MLTVALSRGGATDDTVVQPVGRRLHRASSSSWERQNNHNNNNNNNNNHNNGGNGNNNHMIPMSPEASGNSAVDSPAGAAAAGGGFDTRRQHEAMMTSTTSASNTRSNKSKNEPPDATLYKPKLAPKTTGFWSWLFGFTYIAHGTLRSCALIHPNSPFARMWNVLQVVMLLYIAFGAPFRIAFDYELPCVYGVVVLDLICDTYFMLDIVLNFVTAKLSGAGMVMSELDDDLKSVAWKYCRRGEVVFDCIISLPVTYIELGLNGGICTDNSSQSLLILRLPRMLRMARLLRVVRFVKIFKLPMFQRANPFIVRMWKLGFGMLFVLHLAACVFWYIKCTDTDERRYLWELSHSVLDLPPASKYLASLYYVTATFTTVGYGDISGENDQERVFALFAMLFGAVIFATVISSVSSLVASSSIADNQRQAKIQYARRFVEFWGFPKPLATRVLDFYYHSYSQQSLLLGDILFEEVPAVLRTELVHYMAKDTLGKVELFKGAPDEYVQQIFLSLTIVRATPGEELIRAGAIGEEMYIIATGEVMVLDVLGQYMSSMSEGDVFGEVALVRSEPRSATVVASSFCELYLLRKDDFEAANRRFPEMRRRFRRLAFDRARVTCGSPARGGTPQRDGSGIWSRNSNKVAPAPSTASTPALVMPTPTNGGGFALGSSNHNSNASVNGIEMTSMSASPSSSGSSNNNTNNNNSSNNSGGVGVAKYGSNRDLLVPGGGGASKLFVGSEFMETLEDVAEEMGVEAGARSQTNSAPNSTGSGGATPSLPSVMEDDATTQQMGSRKDSSDASMDARKSSNHTPPMPRLQVDNDDDDDEDYDCDVSVERFITHLSALAKRVPSKMSRNHIAKAQFQIGEMLHNLSKQGFGVHRE